MTIETAEEFLPSGSNITNAFDRVNASHTELIGDLETLLDLLQENNADAVKDYLRAALGWLANRSTNQHLVRLGTDAWNLIVSGGSGVLSSFATDTRVVLAEIEGDNKPKVPDPFLPEALVAFPVGSPEGKRVLFISSPHFVIHAQDHPIEAIAHVAAATSKVRDFHMAIGIDNTRAREESLRFHHERAMSVAAQVYLTAGNVYQPSSDFYRAFSTEIMHAYPNGPDTLPNAWR